MLKSAIKVGKAKFSFTVHNNFPIEVGSLPVSEQRKIRNYWFTRKDHSPELYIHKKIAYFWNSKPIAIIREAFDRNLRWYGNKKEFTLQIVNNEYGPAMAMVAKDFQSQGYKVKVR